MTNINKLIDIKEKCLSLLKEIKNIEKPAKTADIVKIKEKIIQIILNVFELSDHGYSNKKRYEILEHMIKIESYVNRGLFKINSLNNEFYSKVSYMIKTLIKHKL